MAEMGNRLHKQCLNNRHDKDYLIHPTKHLPIVIIVTGTAISTISSTKPPTVEIHIYHHKHYTLRVFTLQFTNYTKADDSHVGYEECQQFLYTTHLCLVRQSQLFLETRDYLCFQLSTLVVVQIE